MPAPSRLIFPAAFLAALLCALTFTVGAPAAHAAKPTTVQKIVSIARAELNRGVREIPDGSNRGVRIQMYGQSTSPRFYPAPWCAYFASWVAAKAGRPIGASGKGLGYVPYIRAWAKNTNRWKATPRPGDLVTFPQHVGVVEKVYANHTLTTIEGNSSNRVTRRWRNWKDAMGYVRVASGGKISKPATPSHPKPTTKPKPTAAPIKLQARITAYPGLTVATDQRVDLNAHDSGGDIVKYAWDLDGDGSYDNQTGDEAQVTFRTARQVKISLRVTDRKGKTSVAQITLTVRHNEAPVAKLVLPDTVAPKVEVWGDASQSYDPDGKIVKYEWDLNGDGTWGADEAKHSIVFAKPGTYTAGLRVTDNDGAVSETVVTINVTNKAPVAKMNAPAQIEAGKKLWADADDSYDPDGKIVKYEWDLNGDGTWGSNGSRSSIIFDRPGTYTAFLRVYDNTGEMAQTSVSVVVVEDPAALAKKLPVARISAGTSVKLGQTLDFGAGKSWDPDGDIVRFQWDFSGDGQPDLEGAQVRWRFAAPGVQLVTLTVTDNDGRTATATLAVTVINAAPLAQITLPAAIAAGQAASFSAAGSRDFDGSISSYQWLFDGTLVSDLNTEQAQWAFSGAGEHTVTLRVTDQFGAVGETTRTVTVGTAAAAPTAVLGLATPDPLTSATTYFTAAGSADSDGRIVRYDWDFTADGVIDRTTSKASTSPGVRFTTAGSYTVTLRVTDDDGMTATAQIIITVRNLATDPSPGRTPAPPR